MKFVRACLFLMLGLAVSFNICEAQSSFGTIVGIVQDQSGSAVSNAPIQVENTATGVVTRAQSQSDGNYTVIDLVPGTYVVTANASGFAKAVTPPTELVVNQTLRLNLVLHPGAVTQTVRVSAAGTLIDTDTAAISQVVTQRQVADLPLVSRNVLNLVALSPGVFVDPYGVIGGDQSSFRAQLSGGNLYIGGNRGSSNAYLIDGVDDNDPGFQTPTITPPIDAIQAFRVMNQNYSAEYGGSAAQVNIETKSGTNALHGEAYEFLRNDAFNAIPDFQTKQSKPVLRYNQFGAALGGPVWIPRVVNGRNRLFFYGAYEGVRSHSTGAAYAIFPTAAELTGNFAGQPTIYDPSTGAPFPGNQITTIDPKAQKLISDGLFNTTYSNAIPGLNAVAILSSPDNIDQYMVRVDAHLGANNSLFARFSSSDENRLSPSIYPFNGTSEKQLGKNIAVDYTHIFTPNFINDLHFGLNRPITYQLQDGANTNNIAGIFNGTDQSPVTWGAPYVYFVGYGAFGGNANGPINYFTTDAKFSDVVTWIHGPHTVQAGLDVGKLRFKEANLLLGRGLMEYLGYYTAEPATPADPLAPFISGTGSSIADFLLGDTFFGEVLQGNYTGWYDSWGEGGFVQDAWKVGTNLTVNLGLRYDYQAPLREEFNRVSTVDLNYPGGRLLTPNAAAVAAADSPLVGYTPARDLVEPTKFAWQPRVGLSYRPFKNTVVRGGYGVYYDSVEFNEYIFPVLNAPFQKTAAVFGGLATNPVPLDTLFPVSTTTAPVPTTIASLTLDREHGKLPYVQQYNFNVQHQLPGDMTFEVGYIGSKASRVQDRLDPAQGQLMKPGDPSSIVFHYPNFASILLSQTNSSSNYNALIARFEKRFSHGFSFLASYTWSKALGGSSALGDIGTQSSEGYQNTWDPGADYGPLSYDIRNNFVFAPIWELPFGRGRMIAANAPAVVNALIGGWQAQGIFTAHSGYPFSILATNNSDTKGGGSSRASLVPGQNPFKKTPGRAFNINAFQQPALATFGNSGNNMMRGLGINNTDFSLIKNTTIHESLGFQLRVEAFNVFNQSDLGPFPGVSITNPLLFGKYNSIQNGGRVLQVALQVHF